MVVTEELLQRGMSLRGSWSEAQLQALGLSLPLVKGWRRRLMGSYVSDAQAAEFLRLKDKHLTAKSLDKLATQLLKGKDPRAKPMAMLERSKKKKKFKGPPPPVHPTIEARAQMLVSKFGGGGPSGSHTTTCTAASCTFPACLCL